MIYWIFDLDNTLYQGTLESYDQLNNAPNLKNLITSLPGKKILFTNGTFGHAKSCLIAMQLHCFDIIISRDMLNDLKPNFSSYLKMIKMCKINPEDKCIFFEDTVVNLIEARRFNWVTVLVNPIIINNVNVNYSFSNIYIALKYFLKIINR